MEVTMVELWLFAWAIGATAYALKRDGDAKYRGHLLQLILENKKARAEILTQFDLFKEKENASKS